MADGIGPLCQGNNAFMLGLKPPLGSLAPLLGLETGLN